VSPYLALLGTNSVIFRWRMQADGTSSNYGGWNLDSVACFSTTTPLPELITPLGGGYTDGDAIVYISPDEIGAAPGPRLQGVAPLIVPDDARRRTEAPLH